MDDQTSTKNQNRKIAFSVYLSEGDARKLKEVATEKGLSVSELVRWVIESEHTRDSQLHHLNELVRTASLDIGLSLPFFSDST